MAVKFALSQEWPAKLLFKNPYTAEDATENIVNPLEGKLWNTGDAVTGQAHGYDDCGLVAGKSYVKDATTNVWGFDNSGLVDGEIGPEFTNRHIAAIRLYKNNEYVYLLPGDSAEIEATTSQELAYYLHIQDSEILTLTNRSTFEVPQTTTEDGGDGGDDSGTDTNN